MALFNKKKENGNDEFSLEKSELEQKSKEELPLDVEGSEVVKKKDGRKEEEENVEPKKEEEMFKKRPSFQVSPIPSVTEPLGKTVKSETRQTIENILSEDLEDIFFKLSPEKQEEIEEKKEEISFKIEGIINGVKIKIKEIFKLIREWLKLIPGVNIFFLEQETKIKIDEILELSKKIKK